MKVEIVGSIIKSDYDVEKALQVYDVFGRLYLTRRGRAVYIGHTDSEN